ncbi:hypothetical protein C8F04DRAFT_1081831 [Mycena alexandri]|uniref:Uncharacterized protein n=1 Tax=Mycena alexandri TaxID=1745969 RepID=A0AAD6TB73_9AGAR|nr:hypothetical protein C8F04DRAFT_1081831 [Mycena alexandri]
MSTTTQTQPRASSNATETPSQTQPRTSSNAETSTAQSGIADINGVHPSAVGANTQPDATKTQPASNQQTNKESAEGDHLDSQYPEQKHAGAVGYGPNYHQTPGFLDKVTGLKEEVKGKVTHNPELAAQGHDRMTGELKKKELEADAAEDPFANPEEKQKGAQGGAAEDSTHTPSTKGNTVQSKAVA